MLIWKPLMAFPLPLAHSYTGPCRRWLLASTTQVRAYVLHHAWKKYKNHKKHNSCSKSYILELPGI